MLFRRPHQFLIMSYENRMISLKTLFHPNMLLETDGSLTVVLVLYKRPMSCVVGNQASVFFYATFPFSFLCPFLSINSGGLADLESSYTVNP